MSNERTMEEICKHCGNELGSIPKYYCPKSPNGKHEVAKHIATEAKGGRVTPEEVPDLYRLAYMPGVWRCPKCKFQLTKQTLSMVQGAVGTTEEDRQSEQCPNDGEWMVPVTYRETVAAFEKRCFEEMDRSNKAESELAALRSASKAPEVGTWPVWVIEAAKSYMQVQEDFRTGKVGGIESLALCNLSSALGGRVISSALKADAAPVPTPPDEDALFRVEEGCIICRLCNFSNPLKFGSGHYTDCRLFSSINEREISNGKS